MTPSNNESYWMSLEDLKSTDQVGPQPERSDDKAAWSRRSFLRAAGFGGATVVLAGCSPAPIKKAIPFLVPAEEVVPGRAYYYASTCAGCDAGCGLMVKNRDGRPIKLEGFRGAGGPMDRSHPISGGGLCSVGQAGLLGLYDSKRHKNPKLSGKDATWPAIDEAMKAQLALGQVCLLTSSVTSPSTAQMIRDFSVKFPGTKHVQYDEQSCSAIADAHELSFGVRAVPHYHFDKADVVVGIGCDFLGTWVSPVEFSAAYMKKRKASPDTMSWHAQVEGTMSMTGSKSDRRFVATESDQIAMIADLAHGIAKRAGVSLPAGLPQPTQGERAAEELEVRLWAARGKSLVVSSLQHVGAQVALAFINDQLGSYGTTIDIENPIRTRQGNDADLLNLIADMKAEKVKTLIVHDLNPVFDLPDGKGFANALKKVPFVVSTVSAPNEMSMAAKVVCPEPHFLERWDDSMPVPGVLCLTQPALSPTFKTRTFRDSLATWMDLRVEDSDYRKSYFEKNVDWRSGKHKTFNAFWTSAIHDGVAAVTPTSNSAAKFKKSAFAKAAWPTESVAKGFELLVYEKAGMPSSRHAHNAWLQELPDPMTKICWGNVALLGVVAAEEMEVEDGDVVSVKVGSQTIELPAKIQPGQHERVVAIALGYGRSGTERFEKIGPDWLEAKPTTNDKGLVGTNVAPLRSWAHGLVQRSGAAQVSKTKKHSPLAVSQSWSSIDLPAYTHPGTKRRNGIVEETTTGELLAQGEEAFAQHHTNDKDLWADDHANGHPQWGMSIDLSQCTGCSACVISCQVENNIPVVGKDEVRRKRDMQWMRIDRYYSGNPKSPTEVDVVHQPMMCQHCGNAPCETVCPVLATVHSEEGLNQQIYNRCVGTRYCANNCPYKVRRFNWFDYSRTNLLENMVLNPDIAVRSRGVMEKCSFCVQRIQEAKTEAKRLGIKVPDGAVQPACAQACPTEAITFGDRTKKENAVAKAMADPLNYKVLESLNVKPAVGYRRLVRNRNEERK